MNRRQRKGVHFCGSAIYVQYQSTSETMWRQCTRASRKRKRFRGHPAAAPPCVTVGAFGKRPLCGLTAPPRAEQRSRSQRHPFTGAWAPLDFRRPLFPPATQPQMLAGGEECLCLCRRLFATATRLYFFFHRRRALCMHQESDGTKGGGTFPTAAAAAAREARWMPAPAVCDGEAMDDGGAGRQGWCGI